MSSATAPFIRTVLGDIAPGDLDVCYAHEHLIIEPSFPTEQSPDFLLDDVDRCTAELIDAKAAGAAAMVDSMPMACGRNVVKLAEVSRRSGVHVLCPTGLHLQKYYPAWHWCARLSAERLAELFVDEIDNGIDTNDGNGPARSPTPHRAGLIKIASGLDRIDPHEARTFEAAATAHVRTGAPILTHTEQGTAALDQARMLADLGVDLRHVVLSHSDRRPDVGYHREILSTGVKIEYDSAFRWKAGSPNHTLDLLLELLADFPDQIMLGMDAARRSYWQHYGGGPGMSFLVTGFTQQMKQAGITGEQLRRIFATTPAATYSFTSRSNV